MSETKTVASSETAVTVTRVAMDGQDVERVALTVNRMRSIAFLSLRGEDGKLHMFTIDPADWDRITAEQSADKYAHES